MTFTPLDVRSSYSLLKSPTKITDLVMVAKERGYSALALTDQNVLYGVVDFYNAAKQAGIKPLLGLQLTLTLGDGDSGELTLNFIAQNQEGYQHLMDLSTRYQTTPGGPKSLTFAQVSDILAGMFVIILPQVNVFNLISQGHPVFAQLKEAAGGDNLLVGTNPDLDPVHRQTLADFAHSQGLALIGTRPVDYLNSTDLFATNVLQAIGAGAHLKEETVTTRGGHYLRSAAQVATEYRAAGLESAAAKTAEIAERCNVELKFKSPVLPPFKTPAQLDSSEYLRQLCQDGLAKRSLAPGFTAQDYQRRLDHELKVIHEMGFDDYFLIVWDVMNFAHRQKIMTDPGRGSAAGSLVAYALAITEVDPLEYRLLFERFLNPERAQMPDIDLDIPDNRRDEVLRYVHDKYGHRHVGQIITFGTLAAKQVLRDTCRVFSWPRYDTEELLGMIPGGPNVTLAGAIRDSQRLQNYLTDHPRARKLMDLARKLEGLPRHYSIHAAGVVLAKQPLHEIVPLQNSGDGMLMTQFTKEKVEALGLLKMDFLGLKNLSILARALDFVHRDHPQFDLNQISYNDLRTLQLFQEGKTDGVFQFESSGIRNVLTSLHPDQFEDIVAVNALYRPGPLENIGHFIARKHGQERYQLPDKSLETILGPTYGVLVYQEQVMQVAVVMAGFTLGQADLLRRAMSKKVPAVMEKMRHQFLAGAQQKGYPESVATQVFDYMDQFANYGFNRSHAVAYSKLAFQLAYLKAHFPTAFYAALMIAETNLTKLRQHVTNARRLGVKIRGPRINTSMAAFTLDHQEIYFGLADVKGVRRDFVKDIIQERTAHGAFADLRDFINRLPDRWKKEELVAPLVYAGAFDQLGYNRAEMITALPDLLSGGGMFNNLAALVDDPSLQSTIERRQEYPLATRLAKENEYLGVYLSGHPVAQYHQLGMTLKTVPISQLTAGRSANLLIFVNRVKVIHTKKDHRPMAFLTGSDESGTVDVTVFPKQYQRYADLLKDNAVLVINGQGEERPGHGFQVIANRIASAHDLQQKYRPASVRWVLRVLPTNDTQGKLQALYRFMEEHQGAIPVIVYYPQTDRKLLQPRRRWMNNRQETMAGLKKILGPANVVLQRLKN